jgi:hypothetical protein
VEQGGGERKAWIGHRGGQKVKNGLLLHHERQYTTISRDHKCLLGTYDCSEVC